MKKYITLLSLVGFGLTACGPTKTDPLKGYHLTKAEQPYDGSPMKPNIQVVTVTDEVAVIQEKEVPAAPVTIETPSVTVETQQAFAQSQLFQVSTEPSSLNFIEGKINEFDVTVHVLKGETSFDFDLNGLKGAEMVKVTNETNNVKYHVKFKPALGKAIPANQFQKEGSFQVALRDLKFIAKDAKVNSDAETAFKPFSKAVDLKYMNNRTSEIPTLQVVGLENAINNKEVVTFAVDVTAPGTYADYKPILDMSFDPTKSLTAKGYQADGRLYARFDTTKNAENISEGVWRYFFIFDTANNNFHTQLDKEGKAVVNPTELLAQLAFSVRTTFGASINPVIIPITIKLPAATPAPAPAPAAVTLPWAATGGEKQ